MAADFINILKASPQQLQQIKNEKGKNEMEMEKQHFLTF